MRKHKIFAFVVSCLFLVGCTTYGSHKKVGAYSYKGVKYDVYEAIEDGENNQDEGRETVLMLVKKGKTPPDRPAGAVAICNASGYTTSGVTRARCIDFFRNKIDEKDELSSGASSGSMY